MSTKRSKVADKKESQGARAAAKEAPSAAKLKLYVPYVFVVEGHCRWEATNPENGGAYVSLHAAIRALIRQLLDDIVLRDGFDRKALRRARSRLQLDESATTADIILGSICDAESKESETPRSSTQLAMRVMNTFMIACEDAYFRFGIAERIFNEAENGAPADCVEDANDQHCKVRGYGDERKRKMKRKRKTKARKRRTGKMTMKMRPYLRSPPSKMLGHPFSCLLLHKLLLTIFFYRKRYRRVYTYHFGAVSEP
jgi:hypothetical protein